MYGHSLFLKIVSLVYIWQHFETNLATATTGNEESTGESNGNGKCGSPKTCIKGPKGSRGRPGKLGERGPTGPRVKLQKHCEI